MENRKLRVLVITLDSWNINNVTGSTMSSIFEGIEDFDIANIYLRAGLPNNKIVKKYFQITNKQLIQSIFNGKKAGRQVFVNNEDVIRSNDINVNKKGIVKFIYSHKWQVFYWMQELLWVTNKWKSKELERFIFDFNPDIIFLPIFYNCYVNKIGLFVKKLTNKPMVSYISDDNYTLKQFNLSPLYWIDRFIKRPIIKKVINESKQLYVITDEEKNELDKIFGINSTILTKGDNFSSPFTKKDCLFAPYNCVFLGGLGNKRDKTVLKLAQCINDYNKSKGRLVFTLDIYSRTFKDLNYIKKLNQMEGIRFNGPIESNQIEHTYIQSDILIHVEPFDLKNRLYYRHSFSTKIVDCMKGERCVLAYGGATGTTNYLMRHDCGLYASSKKELLNLLESIDKNPELLNEYAFKAYQDGEKYHNKLKIQTNLVDDFKKFSNSTK